MSTTVRRAIHANWSTIYALLTVILDGVAVFLALAIGYALNFSDSPFSSLLTRQWKLVLFSIVLYTFLGAIFGIYRQSYSSPLRGQIAAAARAYLLGTLIIFATLFLYQNTYYSHGAPITYLLVFPGTYLALRALWWRVRHGLHRRGVGHDKAVGVVLDPGGEMELEVLKANPHAGYDIELTFRSIGNMGRLQNDLLKCVHDRRATLVIMAASSLDKCECGGVLHALAGAGIPVRVLTGEIHSVLSRMRLYDRAGIAYSVPVHPTLAKMHHMTKRAFDVLLSCILLILASPIFLILAAAIKIESHGEVLFRQVRSLSRDSARVMVFKFRSMASNAEEMREGLAGTNGGGDILFKLRDDPRRTGVGKIIRKFSLDEIPQLLNVLKGDMALVGPRPLPVNDFEKMSPDDFISDLYSRRSTATPGITGLWQVSGRSSLSFRDMVILDLYYAENQTLLFDFEILLQTIPVVLSGQGAY